jgi:leukotriene-A4 hydrolase
LGHALEIFLPSACVPGVEEKLRVAYNTNKNSQAINWLNPSQTAGKKLPYLFT